jgi:hypothetical protein
MAARPHVSPALWQLRGWVTLAGATLVLCALAQVLLFCFVHFTDIRWTNLRREDPAVRTVVVYANGQGGPPVAMPAPKAPPVDAVDLNRVKTPADSAMRVVSNLAVSLGLCAALTLAVLIALGVAICAGAAVPGVERVVMACFWSIVLAVATLPWAAFTSDALFPGTLAPWSRLTADADAGRMGEIELLARYLVSPALAASLAAAVTAWFRSGVNKGIIITAVSELDERLHAEMQALADRGGGALGTSSVRAVGALNRAIGDVQAAASPGPSGPVGSPTLRRAAGAESLSGDGGQIAPSLGRRPI